VALYRLACQACGAKTARLAPSYSAVPKDCGSCGGVLARAPTGPSTQVMERLDNGAMPRAVERLADAERLYEERARASDPLAGGVQRVNHNDD
jgi:ribosomal protein S27E